MAAAVSLGKYHTPALVREVQDLLALIPGDRWIDATVGDGGHAVRLLEATAPDGEMLGIDADPESLERSRKRLQHSKNRMNLVNDNFSNLSQIVDRYDFQPVSAILLDLGLSSYQLDHASRGFSFRDDSLDMRLSPKQRLTASEIVNSYSEEELRELIAVYGEEMQSKRIARAIVQHRPIHSAHGLGQIIERAAPRHGRRIHPATKAFQAIRICVNEDLRNLESFLTQAIRVLRQGGRLAVIAYHSLEDRLVKLFLRQESRDCICPSEYPECTCDHKATLRILTKKVIKPTADEVEKNPRVRSARLRVGMKLTPEGLENSLSGQGRWRPVASPLKSGGII